MNDDFVKHTLRRPGGKKWLDKLPEIIKTYEEKWNFKAQSPYELSYNYVAPVTLNDGSKAVIKIGLPNDRGFELEMGALKFYEGEGSVKLLKSDLENSIVLLEQADPGKPLSEMNDEDEAIRILARVMKKLWKPAPENNNFQTLQEWTQALDKYLEGSLMIIPRKLVEKSRDLFKELDETTNSRVLVHGDIHHDNVLSSKRGGWLSIDPKGVVADPLLDTAALIRNPYEKISKVTNLKEVLECRISILSEELNADSKRIYKWCLAQTILSGVWTIEDKEYTDYAMFVIDGLLSVKL